MIIKKLRFSRHPFNGTILKPVQGCLGSRLAEQMYSGVSSGNSTLLTGQYDDEDSFEVDPACDMNTDRFDVRVDSRATRNDSSATTSDISE